MAKADKSKKPRPAAKAAPPPARVYSAEAQEVRALLKRVPDGFQAALNALAARADADRERVMAELARGMGKEILPLVRAAALGQKDGLACSALTVLPVFGTRAAADVLVEAHAKGAGPERGRLAWRGAQALEAQGIHVAIPEPEEQPEAPRYTLRETSVSAPDGVGSCSVAARLQDQYGVWHAILILWNDQAGVKDGFMRPLSRAEWAERMERVDVRGLSWVACPPDYARWQIANARALNAESGFPLGNYLEGWDEHLGPPPEGYQPPDPVETVRAAGSEQEAQWLEASGDLFKLPDVQRWFVEAADCVPWVRRWSDLQSRLRRRATDSAELPTAEVDELMRAAANELIDDKQRRYYLGRLLHLSRVCQWREQPAQAGLAAAVAGALESGAAPGDLPFFLTLVRRSVTAAEAMLIRGEDLERLRYRPTKRYQSGG